MANAFDNRAALDPSLSPNPILTTPDGKRYQTGEYHFARVYDTIVIPAGAIATNQIKLFQPQGKSPLDTNVNTAAKIPSGQVLAIERVGVRVLDSRADVLTLGSDIKKILTAFYLDLKVNKIEIALGPLVHFPPGIGVDGQTQEAGMSVVHNGVINDSAPMGLRNPVVIDNTYELIGFIAAPLRDTWDTGVTRPALDAACYLEVSVQGMQFQAALIDGSR